MSAVLAIKSNPNGSRIERRAISGRQRWCLVASDGTILDQHDNRKRLEIMRSAMIDQWNAEHSAPAPDATSDATSETVTEGTDASASASDSPTSGDAGESGDAGADLESIAGEVDDLAGESDASAGATLPDGITPEYIESLKVAMKGDRMNGIPRDQCPPEVLKRRAAYNEYYKLVIRPRKAAPGTNPRQTSATGASATSKPGKGSKTASALALARWRSTSDAINLVASLVPLDLQTIERSDIHDASEYQTGVPIPAMFTRYDVALALAGEEYAAAITTPSYEYESDPAAASIASKRRAASKPAPDPIALVKGMDVATLASALDPAVLAQLAQLIAAQLAPHSPIAA